MADTSPPKPSETPKSHEHHQERRGGHSLHSRIIFLIHFYMMCLDEQCANFRLSEWQKRRSEIKKQAREGVQETVLGERDLILKQN